MRQNQKKKGRICIFSLSIECCIYQEITFFFYVSDFLILPCGVYEPVCLCEPHAMFSQMLPLNIICADAAVLGLSLPMVLSYLVSNYPNLKQTWVITHYF